MQRRETCKEALERLKDEIKKRAVKVSAGKADGATSHGSICAAGFGASALGRVQHDLNFYKHRNQENKFEQKKSIHKNKVTKAQIDLANKLGATLPKDCTKAQACKKIQSAITRLKLLKKSKRTFKTKRL
jgi:hypothetical protein